MEFRKYCLSLSMRDKRLYKIWDNMIQRCKNLNYPKAHRYSKRNISVCREWEKYSCFRDWALQNGYRSSLSIDRIDNDKGYFPENCQWITLAENTRKATQKLIFYKGKEQSIKDWALELGLTPQALYFRISVYKWTIERAFNTPLHKRRNAT